MIFKSTLQSSGQGGGPGRQHGRLGFPVPQPSRPRSTPEFPLRAAGAECPVGFHSQTPGLPRWGAGLGQGQKSQAGCPNPPRGFSLEHLPSRQDEAPRSRACCPGGGDHVWSPQLPVPSAGCPPSLRPPHSRSDLLLFKTAGSPSSFTDGPGGTLSRCLPVPVRARRDS